MELFQSVIMLIYNNVLSHIESYMSGAIVGMVFMRYMTRKQCLYSKPTDKIKLKPSRVVPSIEVEKEDSISEVHIAHVVIEKNSTVSVFDINRGIYLFKDGKSIFS